ncbi:MAG: hypothetical protein KDD69_18635 [Bdellovibrionales bacterium]|nr:hypothetical protein [Bdellovibrionales bacterium]
MSQPTTDSRQRTAREREALPEQKPEQEDSKQEASVPRSGPELRLKLERLQATAARGALEQSLTQIDTTAWDAGAKQWLEKLKADLQTKAESGQANTLDNTAAAFLTHLRMHGENQATSELVQAVIKGIPEGPNTIEAAVRLSEAHPHIQANLGGLINHPSPQMVALGLRSLASETQRALNFDEVLNVAARQFSPPQASPSESDLLTERLFGTTKKAEHSPEVAIAAVELLASRKDVALPANALEQLTELRQRLLPSESSDGLSRFRDAAREKEIDTAILHVIEAREPPGALDYLRKQLRDSSVSERAAAIIAQHEPFRSQYQPRQMVEDYSAWLRSGASLELVDRTGEILSTLFARSVAAATPELDARELSAIATPLLSYASGLHDNYPRLWGALDAQGADPGILTAQHAAPEILAQRAAFLESNRTLFAPGMDFIGFAGDDARLPTEALREIADGFDMRTVSITGGSMNEAEMAVQKADVLRHIREAAAASDKPTTIFALTHGGPKHLWLTGGRPGTEINRDERSPQAISHVELAEALLATADKTVSLGHLNLVLDACRQHEFASNLNAEIVGQARARGLELESLPTAVSASPPKQYEYIDALRSGSILTGELQNILDSGEQRFTASDLVRLDEALTTALHRRSKLDTATPRVSMTTNLSIFSSTPFPHERVEQALRSASGFFDPEMRHPFSEVLEALNNLRPYSALPKSLDSDQLKAAPPDERMRGNQVSEAEKPRRGPLVS